MPLARNRRQTLVEAAISAITHLGPAVGLADIAERAGLPRPHVYRTFSSKDELDAEVARVAADDFLAHVQPALTTPGTMADIAHRSITAAVSWAAEHPNLYRFIAARQLSSTAHRTRSRGRFLTMILEAGSYVAGPEQGSTATVLGATPISDAVLAGIMGMVDTSIIWWLDHQDEEQAALVDRLARQITIMIGDLLRQRGVEVSDDAVLGG